jgi:RimJ/RimL family protein N-acetyltransferase
MNFTPETPRLRLRRLTLDDQRELLAVFADPYAKEFYPEMTDPKRIHDWIEWNLRNYEEYGLGLWALELKPSGKLIGDCGLTYQDVEGTQELEVGYHVIHTERRKGYALEAAQACLDFGFQHTPSTMICSIVRPSNLASRAVAARLHAECREFVNRGKPALLFFTKRSEWKGAVQ